MKVLLLTAVLVAGAQVAAGAAPEGRSAKARTEPAREPALNWKTWDAGLEEARKLQRPVLVNVYTKWCGWCRRMDRDVYSRQDVRALLDEKFVTVKLDAEAAEPARYEERSFTSRTLASHFRITGYPTTLFLRANGEHLVNVPGYVEADQFLLLLRYVGDGHLESGVPWDEFKAEKRP